MFGAEYRLPDRQRSLVERLRLGIVALFPIKFGEVIQASGHVGMIVAEVLLPDLQRTLVERFGLSVTALVDVKRGEVVERDGYILMIGAEFALTQTQGFLSKRYGLLVTALGIQLVCAVVCVNELRRFGEGLGFRYIGGSHFSFNKIPMPLRIIQQ